MNSEDRRPLALVVEDDGEFARVISREIQRMGFTTLEAATREKARELLEGNEADVILLDLRLGDADGIELLGEIKDKGCPGEVVVLTGHGTVENALAAMKRGAFDFLTKPCKLDELEVVLHKACKANRMRRENQGLRQYLAGASHGDFVTRSPAMTRILDSLDRVAESDVPVLITGESGTGKELIAREIHQRSPQRERPFIAVNCAALQTNILESELFGHEKEAFTGAVKRRLGLFEIADGGLILLDEIGEIDESIQAKLLRILQFGEFRRVGGNETRSTNVRIIAATNKDLDKASREGRFRQDLLFRMNVLQVTLPPLRERREDVLPLTEHFLRIYGGRSSVDVTEDAVQCLTSYSWPGNIRELENVVRRLLVFHDDASIDGAVVRAVLPSRAIQEQEAPISLAEVEKRHILRILAEFNGDKKAAAKALGVALKTLYNKLHAYGWKADGSV